MNVMVNKINTQCNTYKWNLTEDITPAQGSWHVFLLVAETKFRNLRQRWKCRWYYSYSSTHQNVSQAYTGNDRWSQGRKLEKEGQWRWMALCKPGLWHHFSNNMKIFSWNTAQGYGEKDILVRIWNICVCVSVLPVLLVVFLFEVYSDYRFLVLFQAPDLVKAYPPFVNFFENTKEMLVKCDQSKPRFHAFLKICQTKPECGRQSLQELMIRPVQRLPSISLLLNGECYMEDCV